MLVVAPIARTCRPALASHLRARILGAGDTPGSVCASLTEHNGERRTRVMIVRNLLTVLGPILLAIGLLAGTGLLFATRVSRLREDKASLWILFLLYTTGGTLLVLHATGYL